MNWPLARTLLFWLGLAAVLIGVNQAIAKRERLLNHGDVVLLQLAPVDPRSLMQGDYMALRFGINDELLAASGLDRWSEPGTPARGMRIAADGYAVIKLDAQGVGRFVRVQASEPLAPGERLLRYRLREGLPKIGTNAFFFQEGHAQIYESARYGEFRVDKQGDAILVNMRDEKLKPLASPRVVSEHRDDT